MGVTWSARQDFRAIQFSVACCRLVLLLSGGVPPAQAGGPRISTFVMTTQAGYNAWKPSSGAAPRPQVTSFPHGTTRIWFYFVLLGGIAHKTTWQLRLKSPMGQFADGPVETTSYVNSFHMFPYNFDRSARPGVWTIYVLVNGAVLRSRTFTLH